MWWTVSRRPRTSETIRAIIRSNLHAKLVRKCEESKRDGRFPFEGGWYSRTEILLWGEGLRRREREHLINALTLIGLGAGVVVLLMSLLLYVL